MIEIAAVDLDSAKIKVVGVGGGGGNALKNMILKGIDNVDFIAANTDTQALDVNPALSKIQLGRNATKGLGSGANPDKGREAAEESVDEIKEVLKGSDMVFVTAGMGKGTGTGASSIIARVAKDINALVVGIVTKPFQWEGPKIMRNAVAGIDELRRNVDSLIIIPNQRLLEIIEKTTTFKEAFQKVDEVLYNATRGIADIIGNHGTVNVDFADVRTVMENGGDSIMGIGVASGENRAIEAANKALKSPLLDGVSIKGAKGALINISGGSELTMLEISEAISLIEEAAGEDAIIIHGVADKDEPQEEIIVTVVATGFNTKQDAKKAAAAKIFEDQELPFSEGSERVRQEQISENHSPARPAPPRVRFKKKENGELDPRIKKSYYPRTIQPTPTGDKQLNDLKTPAFIRRGYDDSYFSENDHQRIEKSLDALNNPERQTANQEKILNKLMD